MTDDGVRASSNLMGAVVTAIDWYNANNSDKQTWMCGTASVVNYESCQFRVETSYEYFLVTKCFINTGAKSEHDIAPVKLGQDWSAPRRSRKRLSMDHVGWHRPDTDLAIVNNTRSVEEYYALSTYAGLGPKNISRTKDNPIELFCDCHKGPPFENCDVIRCSWPCRGRERSMDFYNLDDSCRHLVLYSGVLVDWMCSKGALLRENEVGLDRRRELE